MKAHCLPFEQIPHTSRLFLDYLSYAPPVRALYPRSPLFSEWLKDEAPRIDYDPARRNRVAQVLDRQNRAWGASGKTLENLERFKRGALAAVTGQQVGLFGGPLFSIFKALSATKLADDATLRGVECVPIFWLATEDHDLVEISQVGLLSAQGSQGEQATIEQIAIDAAAFGAVLPDAPVGTLTFGNGIEPAVARAASLLGDSSVADWLRAAYRPGENMGSSFARLFAQVFADWGVILLDPSDPELHELAKPLFIAAIARARELDDALLKRGKQIESAGYHQQVKVTPSSTLLFEVKDGVRTAVRRKGNGSGAGEFVIDEERTSAREIIDRIEQAPAQFNANVLLRPLVQDYLLPTLVYAGGAAEVAYFAQAAVVYEKLLRRVTPILPRFSATLVEPKSARLLERYHLAFSDVLFGPEKVRENIAARSLSSDLQSRFADAFSSLERSMSALRESVGKLDATLTRAADRARARMNYQMKRLGARASRAELLRNEVIVRHADALSNALFPHKQLQERAVGGISFVARYGPELLSNLFEQIQNDCHDHQVIEL
jgi:bacillithiol synthase